MYGGAKSVTARRWCCARFLLHQPGRAVVVHRPPGISTYTYQKFEKGESRPGTPMNPRLRTLIALATALDMRVEELVGGVSE